VELPLPSGDRGDSGIDVPLEGVGANTPAVLVLAIRVHGGALARI
jgi:hypothetical protein